LAASVASLVALIATGIGVSQALTAPTAAREAAPRVPATNDAKSPFTADPASSLPAGLSPDQTVDPLIAPGQPVVLSWTPVPGAVSYDVEVSTSPGFSNIAWSTTTDQPQVAPTTLLLDGTYWWRVTAIDAAGTRGLTSAIASFAKQWAGQVSGGVLSDTPGGAGTSSVTVTPYLSWDATPGAAYYQAQIATGDQFASPIFDSGKLTQPGVAPGATTVLPDGGYIWRVRAFDAADDPGPWTTESTYLKSWVAPTVTMPADGASTSNFELAWDPVSGADSYEVQVTSQENTFTGSPLVADATTASTAYVPSLSEQQSAGIDYGQYWFRVRPLINGITGTWSPVQTLTYQAPTTTSTVPTLSSTPSSASALTPVLSWTPVTGAAIYRVDIATDDQFNHIVFSELTTNTAWAMRTPLPDDAVNGGYWWRVVWGASASVNDPAYMVPEAAVPTATFTKQSQPILGTAASGVVTAPPLFTWSDVPGAGKYQLQVSRDQQFADSTTQSVDVYGLGTWWPDSEGTSLTSGTWFWRVRPVDVSGQGLTYSSIGSFTISPPAPALASPSNGATVIASPELTWTPVSGACSYDVQVSDTPTFPVAGSGGGSSFPGGANTAQTAYVPTGDLISHAGTWYWHVRAELCDSDLGSWSETGSFASELPPQFNLNAIPARTAYDTRIIVSGQLVANGSPVSDPNLILERRLYPSSTYTAVGRVTGSSSGRFAFSLLMTRSADWRLSWTGSLPIDQGTAPFDVTVVPRVSFSLSRTKVIQRAKFVASGFVYPARPAWIQRDTSTGWTNLAAVPMAKSRFSVALRATLGTGTQHLRLYAPIDARHELATVASASRSLFVYDVIVIKP